MPPEPTSPERRLKTMRPADSVEAFGRLPTSNSLFTFAIASFPMNRSSTTVALATAAAATVTVVLWWRSRARRCKAFPPAKPVEDLIRRGLRKQDLPSEADAIVIGAGPAGLSLAVLLGNFGRKVLVLEQHDRAGGGLHSFTEHGYEFETGFHYLGEMQKGAELRSIVDSLTNEEVEFTNLDARSGGIYDKVVFQNGSDHLGVPNGLEQWLEVLQQKFPEEREAIAVYGRDLKAAMVTFFPTMVWRTLPFDWLRKLLYPLLAAPAMKLSKPASERLDEITRNGKLKAFMGYLALGCIGMTDAAADWRSILGVQVHFSEGAYFPHGGPSAITRAMVQKIESQGGRVYVRARVDDLLWEGQSCCGVVLEKDSLTVRAPIVVSSVGLHNTERFLREKPCHDAFVERLRPLQRTHGHLFLFVGLKGSAAELNLPSNNLWVLPGEDLSRRMAEFHADHEAPFGYVGLAFPSAKDPSYHERNPDRCTCAVVAGDVPWDWFEKWQSTKVRHRGQDYEAFKKSFEERLLDILYTQYPQTKGRVEYVNMGTPLDTNFYLGKTQGESYGLQQTLEKTNADLTWLFAKPKVPHWPKGLLLAGQDVTGDGFAPAVVSAIFASCAVEGFVRGWFNVISMLGLRGTLRALF
ncbi:unnamed protein product [Durusdinium trenchii]|uniref:Amine oxidase domain-containing protein n=1 Tax=Durusdinium trenchii TaxID=1381693 RepID=A0ABP0MH92_9DINO